MKPWTEADIPDQHGRRAVVTGGNSGLGLEIVRALAARGAHVTLTSRDARRGAAALAWVRAAVPGARVEAQTLDLADMASVRAFAAVMDGAGPLDLLIDNAGVMAPRRRELTRDGFELQFGTNHLGHFALTGLLLPALIRAAWPARIVVVASIAHRRGVLRLGDLQSERGYAPGSSYAQSKLANLMFALELDRRLRARHLPVMAVAAHPGVSATNLIGKTVEGRGALAAAVMRRAFLLVGQSAQRGALPMLMAATGVGVSGGDYIGPDGLAEMRGDPAPAHVGKQALDETAAGELWRRSEDLTGVHYLD